MFDALTIFWTAAGIGIVSYAALRAWSLRGSRDTTFGSISERWLAERRLNRTDSER